MGDVLVLLGIVHAKESSREESKKEYVFRSRCTIQGKVCSLITNRGSCTSVALIHLVNKLKLPTVTTLLTSTA